MTLEALLAREAIRETLSRYNLAGDRGRSEELAACFTPDGVLEIDDGWTARGRAEIIERTGRVAGATSGQPSPHRKIMRHHLTTQGIELGKDGTARAFSYFVVVTDAGPDHAGRYVDRLACRDDQWLLTHRRVVIEWWAPESRYSLD